MKIVISITIIILIAKVINRKCWKTHSSLAKILNLFGLANEVLKKLRDPERKNKGIMRLDTN